MTENAFYEPMYFVADHLSDVVKEDYLCESDGRLHGNNNLSTTSVRSHIPDAG